MRGNIDQLSQDRNLSTDLAGEVTQSFTARQSENSRLVTAVVLASTCDAPVRIRRPPTPRVKSEKGRHIRPWQNLGESPNSHHRSDNQSGKSGCTRRKRLKAKQRSRTTDVASELRFEATGNDRHRSLAF